jgi:hypothetical protein
MLGAGGGITASDRLEVRDCERTRDRDPVDMSPWSANCLPLSIRGATGGKEWGGGHEVGLGVIVTAETGIENGLGRVGKKSYVYPENSMVSNLP